MGGMKGSWRELGFIQRAPDELEATSSISQVQMKNPGLPGHQAGYMTFAGHTKELIIRRLAGSMVRDGQFAETDDLFQMDDVSANGTR